MKFDFRVLCMIGPCRGVGTTAHHACPLPRHPIWRRPCGWTPRRAGAKPEAGEGRPLRVPEGLPLDGDVLEKGHPIKHLDQSSWAI